MIPSFDSAPLLLLSLLIPVSLALLAALADRRREEKLQKLFASPALRQMLTTDPGPGRRLLRLVIAGMCIGVAFAGPRWGSARGTAAPTGIDMVIAMDVSLSMLATDDRPNRLERMRQEVRRLASAATGDRIGLIAFAGRSYILTPLTTDAGALDLFIENIDPSMVGLQGSAVSRAIQQGTELLLASESGSDRALVIMSDWESFDSEPEVIEAANRARDSGVSVVTVGFGSAAGGRIPVVTEGVSTFKRDEAGEIVTSVYNAELQRTVAREARGFAIESADSDKASRVRAAISHLQGIKRDSPMQTSLESRFQLFLIPAFMLLLLDGARRRRIAQQRPLPGASYLTSNPARRHALLLLATAASLGAVRQEGVRDDSLRRNLRIVREYRERMVSGERSNSLIYNLGTALIRSDSLSDALALLAAVPSGEEGELGFRTAFNRGYAQFTLAAGASGRTREDLLRGALESYKTALLLQPQHDDARFNYELVLAALRQDGGSDTGSGDPPPSSSDPGDDAEQPFMSGLDQDQAAQLLDAAAADERSVYGRAMSRARSSTPPGGKDW